MKLNCMDSIFFFEVDNQIHFFLIYALLYHSRQFWRYKNHFIFSCLFLFQDSKTELLMWFYGKNYFGTKHLNEWCKMIVF